MSNDHTTHVAMLISWAGLLAGILSPIALLLTVVFTGINIYIAIRRVRRDARLEKLQAELQRPEPL
jgi:4-hydroxybenzoate polyprenyltransferase